MENTQDRKKINNNVQERDHDTPHIAILPCPGMGHLIPHLELAKRLCNFHGIQVTFFVYLTEASAAQSQYLNTHPLPKSLHVYHLPSRDISPFVTDSTDIQTRLCIIVRESLPDVESYIVSSHDNNTSVRPVNVLIADFFATGSFDIADKLGIPKYIFFCPAADLLPFMIYLPILDSQVQGEFVDLKEPIEVPGCKLLQPRDLVDPVRNRKTDGYNWFLHHASRFPLADGILLNTSYDLEPKTIKALREDPILRQLGTPRVYPVGPLIKPSSAKVEVKDEHYMIMAWLNQQPEESVIFVSFGSGGTLSAEQMKELAWGLELSGKRFIWVIRKPVEADASASFFSVGNEEENNPDEYLPHEYQNRINRVGLVIPTWAPQMEILSHSSVGGFLSHCGWNSALESLCNGVPMIAWPLYAEQRSNAAMLEEEIGVAVRVKSDENGVVGREEIGKLISLLMDEGNEDETHKVGFNLRSKAKQLQILMSEAINEGESSYHSLSEVADEWKASTSVM
ncbi:UDP-glycosyltransferase 72B3-like [Papaver somniferum]|uniref:UDP-glycosyltransferase 72B3-like n=1 Tax=Papaver somniferum TaxID=3469 RepID=UPI000E700C7F|nr:UDP-glycosyltransferase 72B3-like [Papaver somniferum]